MELVVIPQDDVAKIWFGLVRDMIDVGFAANNVPMPEDILEQLSTGHRQLWVAVTADASIQAAMLTSVYTMRDGSKMLKMMECGGSGLHSWVPLRSKVEEYAKAQGCDRVLVEGRVGWRGVLKDYKIVSVALEKRI